MYDEEWLVTHLTYFVQLLQDLPLLVRKLEGMELVRLQLGRPIVGEVVDARTEFDEAADSAGEGVPPSWHGDDEFFILDTSLFAGVLERSRKNFRESNLLDELLHLRDRPRDLLRVLEVFFHVRPDGFPSTGREPHLIAHLGMNIQDCHDRVFSGGDAIGCVAG